MYKNMSKEERRDSSLRKVEQKLSTNMRLKESYREAKKVKGVLVFQPLDATWERCDGYSSSRGLVGWRPKHRPGTQDRIDYGDGGDDGDGGDGGDESGGGGGGGGGNERGDEGGNERGGKGGTADGRGEKRPREADAAPPAKRSREEQEAWTRGYRGSGALALYRAHQAAGWITPGVYRALEMEFKKPPAVRSYSFYEDGTPIMARCVQTMERVSTLSMYQHCPPHWPGRGKYGFD